MTLIPLARFVCRVCGGSKRAPWNPAEPCEWCVGSGEVIEPDYDHPISRSYVNEDGGFVIEMYEYDD